MLLLHLIDAMIRYTHAIIYPLTAIVQTPVKLASNFFQLRGSPSTNKSTRPPILTRKVESKVLAPKNLKYHVPLKLQE